MVRSTRALPDTRVIDVSVTQNLVSLGCGTDGVVIVGVSSAGMAMYDAAGCAEGIPPQAFAWWPPSPAIGQRIDFSPAHLDALSYHWAFGDGTVSFAVQPSHRFSRRGPVDVRLTTYDGLQTITTELSMVVTVPIPKHSSGRIGP